MISVHPNKDGAFSWLRHREAMVQEEYFPLVGWPGQNDEVVTEGCCPQHEFVSKLVERLGHGVVIRKRHLVGSLVCWYLIFVALVEG